MSKGVARAAGIMMAAILTSRILGFIRERAVADIFGRSSVTDAFFAAFAIPDLMYYLLVGGALSAAFIPVFTEYLAKGEETEAWYIGSSFLNLIFLLLLGFTILGMIFSPYLAPLVAYNFSGDRLDLLVSLMRIMFPAVFFTALAGLGMGVLYSYKQFGPPAVGPIIYNIAIILATYTLGRIYGVYGMALGVVAGAVGNFLTQFSFARRRNAGYRFKIDLAHPAVRKMFKLMLPSVFGLSIVQLNLLVTQNLASGLPEGSITALRLANRLMQLPLGVFAMAVSTAAFPTMTAQAALAEIAELKKTVSMSLRSIYYITVPAMVGLIIMSEPIVRLLYETGEFTAHDTEVTAGALVFFSFALVSQATLQIVTRVYYSLQDTVTPVKVGLLTFLTNLILNFAFLHFTDLGHKGLALAFSIASFVNMSVMVSILRRRLGGIDGTRIFKSLSKMLAASAVMTAAVLASHSFLAARLDLSSLQARLVETGLPIALGAGLYFLITYALGMEEVKMVLEGFRRRFKRSRS
ncbi:MAG: murein biosynthesis integral membrane protein MurJ [Firmicutes bacterium]|nr:murein biosynthesis integral membrane protein MurJ [Bacillota bacterium]